jgi:hypothetical protein
MHRRFILLLSLFPVIFAAVSSQSTDHWEAIMSAGDISSFFQEYTHLPLVVIETEGRQIVDDPKITARMKIIDSGPGNLNNQFQESTDYEGFIGIEIRGKSSQMFPKKSYSLELRTSAGADTVASLLGMPDEEDWVLYAPYSDKTMLRNALTFHLGSRLGGWPPRNRFCEVWVNGDYIGVYS